MPRRIMLAHGHKNQPGATPTKPASRTVAAKAVVKTKPKTLAELRKETDASAKDYDRAKAKALAAGVPATFFNVPTEPKPKNGKPDPYWEMRKAGVPRSCLSEISSKPAPDKMRDLYRQLNADGMPLPDAQQIADRFYNPEKYPFGLKPAEETAVYVAMSKIRAK